MTTIRSSELLRIPTRDDYEDVIEQLHEAVEEEGGPRWYLGALRLERRESMSYNSFLLYAATTALSLEEKDKRGITKDPTHQTANCLTAGMIFGDHINQWTFPRHKSNIAMSYIGLRAGLMEDSLEEFHRVGGSETLEGLRVGVGVMAQVAIGRLSTLSQDRLKEWSTVVGEDMGRQLHFMRGAGIALHAGFDYQLRTYPELLTQNVDFEDLNDIPDLA